MNRPGNPGAVHTHIGHLVGLLGSFPLSRAPLRTPVPRRSALLSPSPRRPSSRSACATQLRSAWAVGSNCLPSADNNTAIPEPALPQSVRCEPTRPSGAGRPAEPAPVETGGGLDFGMVDTSSPKGQVSTKSGQLYTNALRAVVLNWLDEDECPPRIILCTPSKSIETWVLAAVWPENDVVRRCNWECHPNPEGQLRALPKRRRFEKRPDDYRRKQCEIKKAWPQVSTRLTEAARFEAEFLATIETVTAGRIRCEARDPQP